MARGVTQKKKQINIRISEIQKNTWLKYAEKENLDLTDLIVSSVENKLLNSDRKKIINFMNSQSNYFSNIENNINQIAKIVNSEKNIRESLLITYIAYLKELNKLKSEQNSLFKIILKFLGDDER